ncbi:Histidine ammonia-lyase [subsurface metagenome]
MGLTASKKAYQTAKNVVQMTAIEIYTAYQALEYRGDRAISKTLGKIYSHIQNTIPHLEEDRYFDKEVAWVAENIESTKFIQLAEEESEKLLGD